MTYQLYWGDLHSHCSISYGHGTVEQALMRARQQLDFCSITGHAFWPDMPTDRDTYGEIIDYHRNGFATLAGNWEQLLAGQAKGSCDQQFLALRQGLQGLPGGLARSAGLRRLHWLQGRLRHGHD